MELKPSREQFIQMALEQSVVSVHAEFLADSLTPVLAFHRTAGSDPYAFMLESVEGGERVGRYSFVGRRPFLIADCRGDSITWSGPAKQAVAQAPSNPREALNHAFKVFRAKPAPGLPPLSSGAVGYFGYDTVRWVEDIPDHQTDTAPEPDAVLLFLSDVAAFDHVSGRLHLVVNVWIEPGVDAAQLYETAAGQLQALAEDIFSEAAPSPISRKADAPPVSPGVNISDTEFGQKVLRAKEYVAAGDVFQVVLSRRFSVDCQIQDTTLYRCLRSINPSPYMFLLRLDGWSAVGASPEPLVRVRDGTLEYRPIAGTAPRTGDAHIDAERKAELETDEKERAEHVMLVDLGRNDLGKVAVTGSVSIDEFMVVEKYSHVMHLVSGLSATLREGVTPLDALFACFPAGTVSGAPKIRAMEIIEELEPSRRGLYAGAVGYLDFSGNLDTCIALRTMVVRQDKVLVQAGAGIVADSDPVKEAQETLHKARALIETIARAGRSHE